MTLRWGYSYQENPISSANTMFNVASPLIIQHLVSVGGSWRLSGCVDVHLAYVHGFHARNEGPFQSPLGPVPFSWTASEVSADALTMGLTVRY